MFLQKSTILLFLGLVFVTIDSYSQDCISKANPFVAGFCNNDSIPCDMKNAGKEPDYSSDLYDYRLLNITEYASLQAFGRISNAAEDMESLSCRVYLPQNTKKLRPVILFSSLSSFTSSKVIGSIQNFICSYFAKKGYVVVSYESRKFNIDRSVITDSSKLTDFVSNPYYTSDTTVLQDFISFRDNNTSSDYTFANFLKSLSKGVNGQQLVHDAYLEMIYKVTYDTKYLLELLKQAQKSLNINANSAFLLGGSAASVQSLHAGFLEHPDQMDSILDSVVMVYKGSSFPLEGDLSSDFPFEPTLQENIRPIGVVNLWGFISSLDLIDENDPSVFSAHGTFDNIFSYQITYQPYMQKWFGYGAEPIFHKANIENLHADIYSVCRGKHALYPAIVNCKFKKSHEEAMFKDLMRRINYYFLEHGLIAPKNDIYTVNMPAAHITKASTVNLIPSPTNQLSDSSDHCPVIYPDHFNTIWCESNPNATSIPPPPTTATKMFENSDGSPSALFIFPNPFNDDLLLDIELETNAVIDVYVYTLDGRFVSKPLERKRIIPGIHKIELNMSGLPGATYVIEVLQDDTIIHSQKVMKFE